MTKSVQFYIEIGNCVSRYHSHKFHFKSVIIYRIPLHRVSITLVVNIFSLFTVRVLLSETVRKTICFLCSQSS